MERNKLVVQALMAGVLLATSAGAQQAPAPDNTKMNKRDREPGAVTADQQKMNKPDRETARLIRQSIYKDKALSTYAHNVKIIVQNGSVTLKGPVRSEEEKSTVMKKAAAVAGEGKIVDQLEVTPASK